MTMTEAPRADSPEMPAHVDATSLRSWLTRPDQPRLIDVRSAAEFRAAHIPGSVNIPLPLLRREVDRLTPHLADRIVLICRTDRRAGEAEQLLAGRGLSRLHVLTGGITAWQQWGGDIVRGEGRWDLERQVRLVAGGLVLTGILASTRAPATKWLSGAIGCGLVTAAVTDSCLMGTMLAKLPYNRDLEPEVTEILDELTR